MLKKGIFALMTALVIGLVSTTSSFAIDTPPTPGAIPAGFNFPEKVKAFFPSFNPDEGKYILFTDLPNNKINFVYFPDNGSYFLNLHSMYGNSVDFQATEQEDWGSDAHWKVWSYTAPYNELEEGLSYNPITGKVLVARNITYSGVNVGTFPNGYTAPTPEPENPPATSSITKQEMKELLDDYIKPIYPIIGGIFGFLTVSAAVLLVLYPFIRKTRHV